MKHGHFEMIRLTIGRKLDQKRMFAIWRVDPPWQPITKKVLTDIMDCIIWNNTRRNFLNIIIILYDLMIGTRTTYGWR